MPIPLTQHKPVDPIVITQMIGPKLQYRPSPPYHNLYTRPPPRPPDVTNSIDSQKDYLEADLDRKVDIEVNSPFQEYNNFRNLPKTRQILCTGALQIERPDGHH